MKTCLVVLSLCLVSVTLAYETYIGNSRHPDHPEKCYHNETEHIFEVDEVYKPVGSEYCEKFTCMKDYVIRINPCQKYNVPAECTESKGDSTQAFPECCNYLRCTVDGKEEIRKTGFD